MTAVRAAAGAGPADDPDDDVQAAPTDDLGADLRRAVARLYSRFRSERADGEVGDAALLVLVVLSKQGRTTLSDLARIAKVTVGSMSQTVQRLQELEYVTKTRGTSDRRTVLFQLTSQGAEAADRSRRHRRNWLNARLAALTPAERGEIARATTLLLRIADS